MLFGDECRVNGRSFENQSTRFGALKMLQQYMRHMHGAVSNHSLGLLDGNTRPCRGNSSRKV